MSSGTVFGEIFWWFSMEIKYAGFVGKTHEGGHVKYAHLIQRDIHGKIDLIEVSCHLPFSI